MTGLKTIILLVSMLLAMSSTSPFGNTNIKALFEQVSPICSPSDPVETKTYTEFLPLDNEICRTFGHEKGTLLGVYEDTRNIDSDKYCYYGADVVTYLCQRCNVQFTDKQNEYYALHDREYSVPGEETGDFRCRSCGYEVHR